MFVTIHTISAIDSTIRIVSHYNGVNSVRCEYHIIMSDPIHYMRLDLVG